VYTTRLSDDIVATAETVGAHAEPTEVTTDAEVKAEPKIKVVKASSRGVKTK
jgi:hypothetical protein